ncbi:hypothetical protein D9M71_657510 [compost metagenome]
MADGFRPNPAFDTLKVLTELGIGEALVGTLEEKGTPAMVQRVLVAPPQSRIGPLADAERADLVRRSPLAGRYDQPIDRESAYEMLTGRTDQKMAPSTEKAGKGTDLGSLAGDLLGTLASQTAKTMVRQAANQIGRQLVRGLMGALLGGKRR